MSSHFWCTNTETANTRNKLSWNTTNKERKKNHQQGKSKSLSCCINSLSSKARQDFVWCASVFKNSFPFSFRWSKLSAACAGLHHHPSEVRATRLSSRMDLASEAGCNCVQSWANEPKCKRPTLLDRFIKSCLSEVNEQRFGSDEASYCIMWVTAKRSERWVRAVYCAYNGTWGHICYIEMYKKQTGIEASGWAGHHRGNGDKSTKRNFFHHLGCCWDLKLETISACGDFQELQWMLWLNVRPASLTEAQGRGPTKSEEHLEVIIKAKHE